MQRFRCKLGETLKEARKAVGCVECGSSGFKGRVGVFSILEISDSVREAIRTEKGEKEIEQLGVAGGFQSLEEAAAQLVFAGITTVEEVERAIGPMVVRPQSAAPRISGVVSTNDSNVVAMKKRRVLLVEDDENIRLVISMLLQREFFEVVEASNGYEGLERVFAAPPDLIICDLMMPKMDGLSMVQRVRADARTAALPILMLTANASEENEERLIVSGADDFLSKTTKSEVLIARVNRLLSRAT